MAPLRIVVIGKSGTRLQLVLCLTLLATANDTLLGAFTHQDMGVAVVRLAEETAHDR